MNILVNVAPAGLMFGVVSSLRFDMFGAQRRHYNQRTTLFGCQIHKILQQLQSNLLAFFRVKLRGKNIVAPDR
jgi:hypothetical protein